MESKIEMKNSVLSARSFGGEVVSFKCGGQEYVWEGKPEYWSFHTPVLFPTVCATKNDKVRFDGVEYPLKKHGFARKMDFELVGQTGDKLVYRLTDNNETHEVYPYKFALYVTHTVRDGGFTTEYRVENTDNKTIIFCIGGHPAFRCPMNECESFSDYKLIFEKVENTDVVLTAPNGGYLDESLPKVGKLNGTDTLELEYSDYDNDALIIPKLESHCVSLVNKHTGKGIRLDFNGFQALGIWTPPLKKAPFICLEPWNGLPAYENESGNFEDKPYAISLETGKSYSVSYSVDVID